VSKALKHYVEHRRHHEVGTTDMVVSPKPLRVGDVHSNSASLKEAGGRNEEKVENLDSGRNSNSVGILDGLNNGGDNQQHSVLTEQGSQLKSNDGYTNQEGLSAYVIEGPSTFFLGIIDIFQGWNLAKKAENCAKRTFQCTGMGISAVHPTLYRDRFVKFCCEKVIESLDGHVEVQSQANDSQMLLDTKGKAFPTKLHNFTHILNSRFDSIHAASLRSAPAFTSTASGDSTSASTFDTQSILLDVSRAPIRPARKEKEKRFVAQHEIFSMTLSPAVFTLLVKNADFRDAKIIITKTGEATIESTRAHLEQLTKTARLFEIGATKESLFDTPTSKGQNNKSQRSSSKFRVPSINSSPNISLSSSDTNDGRPTKGRRHGSQVEVHENNVQTNNGDRENFAQLKTIQLRKLMFENGLLDPEDQTAVQSMTRAQMVVALEAFHQRGIPGLDASLGTLAI
jgi:hypothetical protein